jgi:hypothetical protein
VRHYRLNFYQLSGPVVVRSRFLPIQSKAGLPRCDWLMTDTYGRTAVARVRVGAAGPIGARIGQTLLYFVN